MSEYKGSFEHRQHRAQGARDRAAGNPAMIPRKPVVQLLYRLQAQGVPIAKVSRETNIPLHTLRNWVTRERKGVPGKVYRMYAERLFNYAVPERTMTSEQRIRGAQRIYRGLAVRGFGMDLIAGMIGMTEGSFRNLNYDPRDHRGISQKKYDELIRVAGKLEIQDPYDILSSLSVNITKAKAKGQGWHDIGAWDLDAVHLAEAQPDYTGQCGRMAGVLIHLREGQPVCERCERVASDPHGHNKVDPYKLYEVHMSGKYTHREAAQVLGIARDLYSQYAQYLRAEERRTHTLSMVDKTAMIGYCDACRETVKLYASTGTKVVCSNGVKKYREDKGI